jgi:hypothetical protein
VRYAEAGREMIDRLAELVHCHPSELTDALLTELAPGMAEIAGTVLEEMRPT